MPQFSSGLPEPKKETATMNQGPSKVKVLEGPNILLGSVRA